ncbi:hypothetical protein [Corallococcus macrosporus]|uniref:Lipoprotein n=1 Tax=Myxococcus fulvus (strain ATCC BAA-855 / HW-1) TaxID=483219 RepID=F8CJ12_MYXFH|nr:hypothetical protein [Corallococcus macrosporus]AEI67611.1 hypothetical protein LILAB_28650 [Corallococcus macrosporus]
MTSGRFVPFFAGLLLLTATACGGADTRCTDCPAVEGRYRLQWNTSGGLPSACALMGVELPTDERMDISRTGDSLTSQLANIPLRGSISAQGNFLLTGSGAGAPTGGRTDTLSLSGTFVGPVTDGGTASLSGVFSGSYVRASDTGGQRCDVSSPFSATRD